jgi:hypothetical protein
MRQEPRLIVQVPRGSAVEGRLRQVTATGGEIVIDAGPADSEGYLEPPGAGEVVLSVPSPEALARQADEVSRVVRRAGEGTEPLVVVVEAAEELRDDELAPLLAAAGRSSRAVILRIMADA